MKHVHPSFLTRRMVGWKRPLLPEKKLKFWAKLTPFLRLLTFFLILERFLHLRHEVPTQQYGAS